MLGTLLATARVGAAQAPADGGRPGATAADVEFMQGMIAHHAQALAMVALIHDHTTSDKMRLLGERIRISQQDEIGLMQRWLEAHHEAVPEVDSNHVAHMPPQSSQSMGGMTMAGGAMMMPGMLTPEQMQQLAAAKGDAFDRLFLQDMIGHHRGALSMVHKLFETSGAAEVPEIHQFATDIDADQNAEILRMQNLLSTLPPSGGAH